MGFNKAEYAIITSFKLKDSSFVYNFRRLRRMFKVRLRMILQFYRRKKYKELQEKLQEIRSQHFNIIGHSSLLLSLFRGFEKLQIPFTYNKITLNTKYIILCWADAKDIELVRKLRFNSPNIKCVVTAPTACKYDYEYQYRFAQESCVDFSLVASNWVREVIKTKYHEYIWIKSLFGQVVWRLTTTMWGGGNSIFKGVLWCILKTCILSYQKDN